MDSIEIVEITGSDRLASAFAIRRRVFCVEQGVSGEEEFDGRDEACRHYLVLADGAAIGAARMRETGGGEIKIERVAVLAEHRGRGFGRALMRRTIDDAAASGAASIVIHAQHHAEAFYAALGFCTEGGVFVEAGIDHVRMVYMGRAC